jgi:hypothetical protein
MSERLKKKLRKKAKRCKRRRVQKGLEQNGHHARERTRATKKNSKQARESRC